jgi:hypothetical protein
MKIKKLLTRTLCVIVGIIIGGLIWWYAPCSIINITPQEVSKIEIFDGNTGKKTIITNATNIEHIIENLNKVSLKKEKISLGYIGYSLNTTIYKVNGEVYKKFIINASDTIRKDPFFYRDSSNSIDYKYIQELIGNRKKTLVTRAPDGKKIAYLVNSNRLEQKFDHMYVENIQASEPKILSLENISYTCGLKIEWINNNIIAFTGHVNPSLDVYVVFNSDSGKRILEYYGIGFKRDKSNLHTYYTLPQPHFSDTLGNDKIYEDNNIIYESDKSTNILGGPAINEEGNKFVFFERKINNDNVKLVVGEKQQNGKIKINKKIIWDKLIGEIKVINDNTIDIGIEAGAQTKTNHVKFNIKTETIIGTD